MLLQSEICIAYDAQLVFQSGSCSRIQKQLCIINARVFQMLLLPVLVLVVVVVAVHLIRT